MQKEALHNRGVYNESEIDFDSPFLVLDLPTLMQKLKQCSNSADGEYSSLTLLKRPEKEIVLTAFRNGTKLNSFQSNDSISFQIIEGKLMFHTRKKSVLLEKGQFLTLYNNIKYSLITSEETVFLITILNEDSHTTKSETYRYS